jgi:hypothetical protein
VYRTLQGNVSAHRFAVSESTTVQQLRSLCYGKLDEPEWKVVMTNGAVNLSRAKLDATMADVGVVEDTVLAITEVTAAAHFTLCSMTGVFIKTLTGKTIAVAEATADW